MKKDKKQYKGLPNPAREKLKELSTEAREIRNSDPDFSSLTLNQIIIEVFYLDDINTEFHSFKNWIKLGKRVKKGEKGFVIWGKPLQKDKKDEKQQEPDDNEDKRDFWPITYLFSDAQVELIP